MATELACQRGWNCLVEENPDVCAVAGARTFQRGRDLQVAACLPKRLGVLSPPVLVEIDRQEKAGFVRKHRIDAQDEGLALVILAGEMPSDRLVRNGEESLMPTIAALDPGLFAYALDPFVGANRLVARLAGLSAFKSARMDVLAPTKEAAEDRDFRFRRRPMIDDPIVRRPDCELFEDHEVTPSRPPLRLPFEV
jgi:hypothetical protein